MNKITKPTIHLNRSGFFGVLLAMVTALSGFAQTTYQTYQIGNGVAGSTTNPIAAYYGYSYSQQIYLQTDMINEGLSSGTMISKLSFYYVSGNVNNSNAWTIYMGNTSQSEFANNTNWIPLAEMQQVFSGTMTFPATGNWVEIVLDTPFEWNGVDNLVVAMDENQPGYSSFPGATWQSANVGVNRGIYYHSDGTNPNPASPPTATGRTTTIPNVRLFEVAPDCAGTPVHQTISTASSTICSGDEVTFSAAEDPEILSGISFQWQIFEDGAWVDIAGETNRDYTTSALTETTDLQLVSTCDFTGDTDESDPFTVTVNALPVVEIANESYAYCSGESAVMTASGADTYSWSPSAGLNMTSGNMVSATPTSAATYTVVGTDANGCENSASATVVPVAQVSAMATYSPVDNCEAGDPITFTVSNTPEVVSGMGSWEYRWLEEDGETVALNWTNTNEFTFVPATDGVYTYYYQLRSTSCPSNYLDSVKVSATIGFGVESADLVHIDCNVAEGSISLVNAFGQSDAQTFYSNDFSSTPLEANTTIHGVASVTDGRMVVTPSQTSATGGFTIENPDGIEIAGDLSVSFNLTADLPINTWGTGGADGITYSFGDDANYTNPGGVVNGKGSKLRVSFDAAGNSDENGNISGIYVVYGWTATNAFGPGSTQTLAYSDNTSLWKTQTDVPVDVYVTVDGMLTLTVGGVVVFENIQLPQDYADADKSTWKHLFSAGTGGDALRHAIDDLNITVGSYNYGIVANGAAAPTTWQAASSFNGLQTGVYDVWMSNPADETCSKMIGTYEILNNYPIVDLGNDTTICEGEVLTLDAGHPGSTYTWSGTNEFSQTIEVDESGNYICYVTNADGCVGIGSIVVSISPAPSASGIQIQGSGLNQLFAVVNPQNTTNYSWDFGDGTIVLDGASVQNHTYEEDGEYTITVTLTNEFDCDETVITQTVNVNNGTASIEDNSLSTLSVYPNPANGVVTIVFNYDTVNSIEIHNISGKLIYQNDEIDSNLTVSTSPWESGVYLVSVYSNGSKKVEKLVIQH